MPTILNALQLIGTTLIYVALLGALVALVLQFASELHGPRLRHRSHELEPAQARLMMTVATESRFDRRKYSANNAERDAA